MKRETSRDSEEEKGVDACRLWSDSRVGGREGGWRRGERGWEV